MMTALAPRSHFPLLARHPGLHYLDSAATAQKPQQVLQALIEYYEQHNANPHRGAYALSVASTECYHDARVRVARFIGMQDADCAIFTRGTTESLNLLASAWGRANVRAGDNVVVTAMEHHANFVPWQQLALATGAEFRIAELTPDGQVDRESFRSMLNERTRVVAFAHVSNALGTINPVQELVACVRAASPHAIVVCDGAQAVPHLPVNFDSLGVDAYAFSGHKLGAPMGIGVLAATRALLDATPPWQTGGDMIEFVGDDRTTWNVLPHKFEAGTPNVADAVGLAAACDYLDGLSGDAVREHELQLTLHASELLNSIPGVTVLGPPPHERTGVASFVIDGVHPHDIATVLDGSNVCIRAGHHCAQPLMRRLNQHATARASFWVYNTEEDVAALVSGVHGAIRLLGGIGAPAGAQQYDGVAGAD
ncbi:MAG TPA: SufS family cysteine desulfurase [Gemmatimonadales bacterium]|nr:SufS family cysteine desulfurase [Gemmatimonadales bacterium]